MKKVLDWLVSIFGKVGFYLLVIAVVIILAIFCLLQLNGCEASTKVDEPVKDSQDSAAQDMTIDLVPGKQTIVCPPVPRQETEIVSMPGSISDKASLVVKNNFKNLNLRIWIYVNDEQEFGSEMFKSQCCSKSYQILIGSAVKIKAVAEDAEGQQVAEAEETSLEMKKGQVTISVLFGSFIKDKFVLDVDYK
jgi:hypothetical protein